MEESDVNVDPKIYAMIRERGWTGLTPFQLRAFNSITLGKNVLLIAPTGFGKTEAALIPILNKMTRDSFKPVALLYITPLKALINDLTKRIEWWASRFNLIVGRKHGEVPQREKVRRLKEAPHIMVTTPEGLEIDLDWASRFRENFRNIKWVVVDEVHDLVGTKRGAQLSVLLERLARVAGDFQRIGISATIGTPMEVLRFVSGSSKREMEVVSLNTSKEFKLIVKRIRGENSWENIAKEVKESIEIPSLIFTNSRFSTERLHEELEKLSEGGVYVHHSSVSRDIKNSVEESLRRGEAKAVICTKTLELGIHIGDVKKVIMYRPPPTVSSFLQRLGRSGHNAQSKSVGEVICVYDFDVLETLALFHLAKRRLIERPRLDLMPLDVAAREIIGMVLQGGEIGVEEAYNVLKSSGSFRGIRRSTFLRLLEYLSTNGLLMISENTMKLGPAFFRIWRFSENRVPWLHDFSEFFSFINSSETFTLRYDGQVIGELDSVYVYKHVRVNDVIRVSGALWRVTKVNTVNMSVEVVPEKDRRGEIPIWRGENVSRSPLLPLGMESALKGARHHEVDMNEEALLSLERMRSFYDRLRLPIPSRKVIYVQRIGDEIVYSTFINERISLTLAHILLYLATTKNSINSFIRTSAYGFSIKGIDADILGDLVIKSDEEIKRLILKSIRRSPLFYAILKEIQVSFGKVSEAKSPEDSFLITEAMRQTINRYFSIKLTIDYLKKIKFNEIKIVNLDEPSPLAMAVLSHAPIRPWIKNVEVAITSALKGGAYTVNELSNILGLPTRVIETKLKKMRKSLSRTRVACFIDVDTREIRWCTADELESISRSDEYMSSFTPIDPDESFHVMLKNDETESFIEIIIKPREIMEDIREVERKIPFEEITEIRVRIPPDITFPPISPKYYYANRRTVPLALLNIISFLQSLRYS
jgi:ATP-dependent Lhr-like helicase